MPSKVLILRAFAGKETSSGGISPKRDITFTPAETLETVRTAGSCGCTGNAWALSCFSLRPSERVQIGPNLLGWGRALAPSNSWHKSPSLRHKGSSTCFRNIRQRQDEVSVIGLSVFPIQLGSESFRFTNRAALVQHFDRVAYRIF